MTDTAAGEVADHAQQAATALRRLNRLVTDAHAAEQIPDAEKVAFYQHVLRSAVVLGVAATAARGSKLERKYHAFVRPTTGSPRRLPAFRHRSRRPV